MFGCFEPKASVGSGDDISTARTGFGGCEEGEVAKLCVRVGHGHDNAVEERGSVQVFGFKFVVSY